MEECNESGQYNTQIVDEDDYGTLYNLVDLTLKKFRLEDIPDDDDDDNKSELLTRLSKLEDGGLNILSAYIPGHKKNVLINLAAQLEPVFDISTNALAIIVDDIDPFIYRDYAIKQNYIDISIQVNNELSNQELARSLEEASTRRA